MTPDAASGTAARNAPALPRAFASAATFLLVIACYLGWQIVLRLVTSNSAELDEGEQLLLTQHLAWGYGAQPPLYTWLQYPFVQLLGPSILPLALFKNLLLFGIYAFTFLSARRLTRHHLLAVAATLSLLFVPQISWESQRDLTHSVLVTLLAAATFYVFLRLCEVRRLRLYLAFGLCVALGTLSKYSYLLFLSGLFLAAVGLPSLRPVVWSSGMALALALATVLVAPHVIWAVQNSEAVLSATGKFHFAPDAPWVQATLAGLKNLAGSVAAHAGALLGIYFILCRNPVAAPAAASVNRAYLQLIARSLVMMLAMLVLSIVCLRMTSFKDRWLLPIFICLPVYLAAALAPRLNPARVRAMIWLAGTVMVTVSILLPGRIRLAELLNKPDQQNAPFDRLAEQLRPFVPPTATLLVDSAWLGGNLRMFFPAHPVVTPREVMNSAGPRDREYVLVWDATRTNAPPSQLKFLAGAYTPPEATSNEWRYVESPLKFFASRPMRLGWLHRRAKSNPSAGTSPEQRGQSRITAHSIIRD